MVTNNLPMQATPAGISDSRPRPSAALLQRLAQGDEGFADVAPGRFDKKYLQGDSRKTAIFTTAYFAEKTEVQSVLALLGNVKPITLRALNATEIGCQLCWWAAVITGERPLVYGKIDSLFCSELHLLLEQVLLGVQWFPDIDSDGLYHLVLFRKDYEQGVAMASQLTALVQRRDLERANARAEISNAIFMLRYTLDRPLTERELNPPVSRAFQETDAGYKRRMLCEALEAWSDLGSLRNHYFPMLKFAEKRQVHEQNFQFYARRDGLRTQGQIYIRNYWQKLLKKSLVIEPCTLQQALEQWQQMPAEQRKAWTRKQFARSKNLSPGQFCIYAATDAGLKTQGKRRLANLQARTQQLAGVNGVLLHSAIICWLSLLKSQRECLTTASYAILTGADYGYLKRYITKTGLTNEGLKYYKKKHVTADMLRLWSRLTDQQRNTFTMDKFADEFGISLEYWQKYATLSGLTPQGEAEKTQPGPDELLKAAQETFASPQKLAKLQEQGTELGRKMMADRCPAPLFAVKQEPDASATGEYSWEPPIRLHQQWNDAAPLLTSATDPKISLTQKLLGDKPLNFTFGNQLNDRLETTSKAKYNRFIREARRFAAEVISSDGKSQPARFAYFLSEPLQQFVDSAEDPPQQVPAAEGLRVNAARDIPALTVIGAYAGVWLPTEKEQSIEDALIGAERSLSRSWTLPAGEDGIAAVVSGFRNANRLALINTNQLYGLAPLNEKGIEGDKGNNLDVMFINNRLPVYVTTRSVKKGQQLLVNYSALYNPLEIKQESYRTDTLSLIARRYQMPVIIEDAGGEMLSCWNRAGEDVTASSGNPLLPPAIILRQRGDDNGYLWYNAINAQGEIIAHSPEHPEDNFWHALACALFSEANEENIRQLKSLVAEENSRL